jgi:hypothetical protein
MSKLSLQVLLAAGLSVAVLIGSPASAGMHDKLGAAK